MSIYFMFYLKKIERDSFNVLNIFKKTRFNNISYTRVRDKKW